MSKFDEVIDSIFTAERANEYVADEFLIPEGLVTEADMVNEEGSKYFFYTPSRTSESKTITYIINCRVNGVVIPILKRVLTFNLEDLTDIRGMFKMMDGSKEEILNLLNKYYPEDVKAYGLNNMEKTEFDKKIDYIFNQESCVLAKLDEFDVSPGDISLKDMRNACANQYFFLVDKCTDGDDHIFEIFDKNTRYPIKSVLTFKSDGTIKGQFVVDFEEGDDNDE